MSNIDISFMKRKGPALPGRIPIPPNTHTHTRTDTMNGPSSLNLLETTQVEESTTTKSKKRSNQDTSSESDQSSNSGATESVENGVAVGDVGVVGSDEGSRRVRVLVRVRPFLSHETRKKKGSKRCAVDMDESANSVTLLSDKTKYSVSCTYDRVFGKHKSQADVFQEAFTPTIQAALAGINSTIFAYGQTGTGKTYTMLGKDFEKDLMGMVAKGEHRFEGLAEVPDGWGVIPRALALLFQNIETELSSAESDRRSASCSVHCSYMQLYNEQLYDLLQDKDRQFPLRVRENRKGKRIDTFVQGLSAIRVSSLSDCIELLALGTENRVIRSTEYNAVSSRSHAILQLCISIEEHTNSAASAGVSTIIRTAKLNFVDLAGSEKLDIRAEIGATRLQELRRINTSLSSLGTVIQALGEKNRKHIPYRNSLLTRLLQDSLGGNTRTTVICTLSPVHTAVAENYSTLQFADRAKLVMTKVIVNQVVDDAVLLAQAQAEICRLKRVIRQERNGNQTSLLMRRVQALETENSALKQQLDALQRPMLLDDSPQEEPQTEHEGSNEVSSFASSSTSASYSEADPESESSCGELSNSADDVCDTEASTAYDPEEETNRVVGTPNSANPSDIVQVLKEQLNLEEDGVPWDQRTESAMRAAEEEYVQQIRKEEERLGRIVEQKAMYKALLQKALYEQLDMEAAAEKETQKRGREEEIRFNYSDIGLQLQLGFDYSNTNTNTNMRDIVVIKDFDPESGLHCLERISNRDGQRTGLPPLKSWVSLRSGPCNTSSDVAVISREDFDGLRLSSKQRRAAMRRGQRRVIEQQQLAQWRVHEGSSFPHDQEPFQYKGLASFRGKRRLSASAPTLDSRAE